MDPYAFVSKGKLKLKNDSGIKKKDKDKKTLEQVKSKKTKAEMAFQKMQEKMQTERIARKASRTHKERVEKFNRHLDGLTEHYDIPKVSWTK